MKKQVIWIMYIIFTIALAITGYFIAKDDKIEYALSGAILGLVLSLVAWISYGKKHSY